MEHYNQRAFQCKLCNKRFKEYLDLSFHMVRVHEGVAEIEPLICNFCGLECKNEGHRLLHERTHTGEKAFECKICGSKFSQKYNYTNHMEGHAEGNKYECGLCDFQCKQIIPFKFHLMTHEGKLECKICHKSFGTPEWLTKHMSNHENRSKIYNCKDCKEEFEDRVLYKDHRKLHKNVECVICGEKFNSWYKYTLHKPIHDTKPELLNLACKHCPKKFLNREMLEKHIKTIHENTEFNCDQCSQTFASKRLLGVHRLSHSNGFPCQYCGILTFTKNKHEKEHFDSGGNLQFNCKECNRKFENGPDYAAHYMEHYNKLKHACTKCNRRYPKMDALTLHIRKAHPEDIEQKFACNLCPKKFTAQRNLTVHMEWHKKGIRCKFCKVEFWGNRERKAHEDFHIVSKGKIQYKCKECSMEFKNGLDHAAHYMEHYNKLPFGCNLCNRRFTEKFGLDNHITASHQDALVAVSNEIKQQNTNNSVREKTSEKALTDPTKEKEPFFDKETDSSESEADDEANEEYTDFYFKDPAKKSNLLDKDCLGKSNSVLQYIPLPLSLCIKQKLIQNEGIVLVWLKKLEPDVLNLLTKYPTSCILFCQETVPLAKWSLNFLNSAKFYVNDPSGTTIHWQIYSFGCSDSTNYLKLRQFKSYNDVIAAVSKTSKSQDLVNIIRYSNSDFFRGLQTQFKGKVQVCNYISI